MSFPPALQAAIAAPVMRLAFGWRIVRADGIALGFTTHDRCVTIGGIRFEPAPGILPSAVSIADDVEAGGMDLAGALTADAVRAEDIDAGRYDGARAEFLLFDWSDPGAAAAVIAAAQIGEVVRREDAFEAELVTIHARLAAVPIEFCSPECRARLGDRRCRVDLAPLTRRVRIAAIEPPHVVVVDTAIDGGSHALGTLRPLDGVAAGLDFGIAAAEGSRLTLSEDVAGRMRAGDIVQIREGCDRRFSTCRDRFQNQRNFRGEPHVPGTDSVLRYPGL